MTEREKLRQKFEKSNSSFDVAYENAARTFARSQREQTMMFRERGSNAGFAPNSPPPIGATVVKTGSGQWVGVVIGRDERKILSDYCRRCGCLRLFPNPTFFWWEIEAPNGEIALEYPPSLELAETKKGTAK